MRYFVNPSNPEIRAAMAAHPDKFGAIVTPRQGNRVPPGVAWCADNGCFGDGYPGEDAWWAWLQAKLGDAEQTERCAFAVAPDVVADHAATLERSLPWLPRIRELGVPAAWVLQDGATLETVPWDLFDVLFVGGSTAFKLGDVAAGIVWEAAALGYPVHMGRVNSEVRIRYAQLIGCTSVDGTYLTFRPSRGLRDVLDAWMPALERDRGRGRVAVAVDTPLI